MRQQIQVRPCIFPCTRIYSYNLCRSNGACKKWSARASATTKQLTANLNGPLLEMLAGYLEDNHNKSIDSLRDGSESNLLQPLSST